MEEKYFESNMIMVTNSPGTWRKELLMFTEMITTMQTLGSADINISTDGKNTFELGRGW